MKYFTIFSYLLLTCLCGYFLFEFKKVSEEFQKTLDYNKELKDENQLIIKKIVEIDNYIQFIEQSVPSIQKRNAKAKVVKDMVLQTIKETKQNNFKSDREFNDFIFSVVDYSEQFKVSTSLILSVARQESNFNPRAVSRTNAQGIMQLIPSTTEYCIKSVKKQIHDPFYARDSVFCGVWYLKQLLIMFNNDIEMTIAAYNAGPTYVMKYAGMNLPEETSTYKDRVSGFIFEYKQRMYWEN